MEFATFDKFRATKYKSQGKEKPRLFGDLSRLYYHVDSVKNSKSAKECDVCGLYTCTICGICGFDIHYFPQRGYKVDQLCFIRYHSDPYFGLRNSDCKLLGKNSIGKHNQRHQSLIIQVTSVMCVKLPHDKFCENTLVRLLNRFLITNLSIIGNDNFKLEAI